MNDDLANGSFGDEPLLVASDGPGELEMPTEESWDEAEADVIDGATVLDDWIIFPVIALGVLIGGDTNHHEMVGQSVSHALQQAALATRVPIINGVIVTDTPAQAKARTVGRVDRGTEFAHAALEMAALRKKLSS